MEAIARTYNKEEFIETLTGNRVSRKSILCGSQNIVLLGKTIIHPGVIIRGDLAKVTIGKYSVVSDNAIIRPAYKKFKGGIAFFPLTIGEYVNIEEDCIVSTAVIGSFVHIGKGSIISKRSILKDCCRIEPGTVLAPDTVVPPFSVVAGCPGVVIAELPECFEEFQKQRMLSYYDHMQLVIPKT